MKQQLIEHFPLNILLLINGEFPMPVMVTKKLFTEHHDKETPINILKKKIRKFYHKRHFLFKKFDEGIKLDEESWYSVVPEDIAKYISEKLYRRIQEQAKNTNKLIDGFCGSGGLAIQLAEKFDNIHCIDLDPVKLENLKNNAKIYNKKIETQLTDFLTYEHEFSDEIILTLCPPWGGVNYHKKTIFDLDEDMKPSLSDILKHAFTITCVVACPNNIKYIKEFEFQEIFIGNRNDLYKQVAQLTVCLLREYSKTKFGHRNRLHFEILTQADKKIYQRDRSGKCVIISNFVR